MHLPFPDVQTDHH